MAKLTEGEWAVLEVLWQGESFPLGEMKKAFLSSTKSKLGALLVKDSLGNVKKLHT